MVGPVNMPGQGGSGEYHPDTAGPTGSTPKFPNPQQQLGPGGTQDLLGSNGTPLSPQATVDKIWELLGQNPLTAANGALLKELFTHLQNNPLPNTLGVSPSLLQQMTTALNQNPPDADSLSKYLAIATEPQPPSSGNLGPGGTQPILGPNGTQNMFGPGGTQDIFGPGGTPQNPTTPINPPKK